MTGWDYFIAGSVCAGGALPFLRIAAFEVEGLQSRLFVLESRLRTDRQKRLSNAGPEDDSGEPIVLMPLGKNGPES